MTSSTIVATSTIAVAPGSWADPELAAMVAPPVVVSSEPLPPVTPDSAAGPAAAGRPVDPWRLGQLARSRANMPVGRHRSATR